MRLDFLKNSFLPFFSISGEESTKEKKPKTELDESDDEGGESAAKKVKLEAGAKPGLVTNNTIFSHLLFQICQVSLEKVLQCPSAFSEVQIKRLHNLQGLINLQLTYINVKLEKAIRMKFI